jgi:DNA ligase 1
MDSLLVFLLVIVLTMPLLAFAASSSSPLMLATRWNTGLPVSHYLVSEKLDGVRAWWDGEQLRTRSGYVIPAPDWFLQVLPRDVALDGELWIGHGTFDRISALVRSAVADDEGWKAVRFMVFDLPDSLAPVEDRLQVLTALISAINSPFIQQVKQHELASPAELQQMLQSVTASGGEGLMLKRKGSLYQARRSSDWMKLKVREDAEAIVLGYTPGKGKYQGMVGALQVRSEDGRVFRIGSGLTDEMRRHPPAPGTRITYSFNGQTSRGLPRFARFVRVRPAE